MNTDLFIKVIFNIKLLKRIIFSNIKNIHRINFKLDKESCYTWEEYSNNSQNILIKNNDLKLFKIYVSNLNKDRKIKIDYGSYIDSALKSGNTDFIDYFFNVYEVNPLRYHHDTVMVDKAINSKNYRTLEYLDNFLLNILKKPVDYNFYITLLRTEVQQYDFIVWMHRRIGSVPHDVNIKSIIELVKSDKTTIDQMKWIFYNCEIAHECHHKRMAFNTIGITALQNGRLDIAQWMHQKKLLTDDSTNPFDLDKLLNSECKIECNTLEWVSKSFRNIKCSTSAMDNASLNHSLDIIKWLHFNRTEGCTTSAMDNAAKRKDLDVICWLHFNRTEGCTTDAMDNAARSNMDILEWLHFNRTEGCTVKAMDLAAYDGNLETLKWLHFNRSEGCSSGAMENASFNGWVEVIEWLGANRTESYTF